MGGLGCSPAEAPVADRNLQAAGEALEAPPLEVDPSAWFEQEKLLPSHFAAPHFGQSVAVDIAWAVIGAPGDGDDATRTASGAAYVFNYYQGAWVRTAKLVSSDGAAGDRFGAAVAVSLDRIVVGAPGDDGSRGAAYVFVRSGGSVIEDGKLVASDRQIDDRFGGSVAISIDTTLVGAPGDDASSGSAYAFVRGGTTWTEQQKLEASDTETGAEFGCSVSVSGERALIGAYLDDASATNSGSAYLFTRSGANWGAEQKLVANDAAANDWFGYSVSLSGDRAIIGAPQDDARGLGSGSAYAFARGGQTFALQQKLSAGDGGPDQRFGTAVSTSGDRAVVGAPVSALANFPGAPLGSAYAFSFVGTAWALDRKLVANDGEPAELFGHAVAVSGSILIGAYRDDDGGALSGSAYVLASGASELRKIRASDSGENSAFGYSVSLSDETALVGAPGDDVLGPGSGAAYLFEASGTGFAAHPKLLASDPAAGAEFGCSVSVDADTAVVGARGHEGLGPDSGRAYVFRRGATSWAHEESLYASDGSTGDLFGYSVSVSGDTAFVGAPGDDDEGTDSGSVYVFRRGAFWMLEQKLVLADLVPGGRFGHSVAVSQDTALVGAPGENFFRGSAYVFRRTGRTWQVDRKFSWNEAEEFDAFGTSVSLWGFTGAIGMPGDGNPGSVLVVARGTTGWVEEQWLEDPGSGSEDEFGRSVSVSGDLVLVGAPGWPQAAGGSAYAFARSGTGWVFLEALVPSSVALYDQGGTSVAISGVRALVGAPGDDDQGTDSGSVHPFIATCPLGEFCPSGSCKDGVCCQTPCTDSCERCDATPGVCTTVTSSEDPDTCAGERSCDENGACKLKNGESCSAASECLSGHCADARCCETACDGGGCDVCNATPGTCTLVIAGAEGHEPSCAPYLCDGASPSCPTSCEDDDDCEQSAFCDVTDSVCKPDQPEGSACSASAQCATGHCVDEVCCDGPCSGTCQACAASLKASASDDGICGDAESGRDPHEDCTEESGGCGQDGQCDGSGACRLRVRGTSCGTGAMCVENLTVGQVCDGLGECTDEPDGIGCSPYRCPEGGAGCSIPCATDDDCTPDAFCDGGECRVRSSPGATCVADAECQTGFCTDGVCCARACEDQCEACDLAGAEGACAPVASDGDCAEGQHCADQGDGSMRCVESQVDCEAQGTCPPGPSPTADDDAGCGCRAAGRRQEGVASALLAALALAMLVGRRRRDY